MKVQIKKWWWKNLFSYGDQVQCVEFHPDKGELFLITAKNGNGKTSMLSALDLALFGECLNKRGKRLSQKLIPNRVNGNGETGVEFSTLDYQIEIKRKLQGSLKTELLENSKPNTKASNLQERIDQITGYDFATFKSFISVNVNIFKDFINLSPEDKRSILDKLFNLEQVNQLHKILKSLAQKSAADWSGLKGQIFNYDRQIAQLESSIQQIREKAENDTASKVEILKRSLEELRPVYEKLEKKRERFQTGIELLKTELEQVKNKRAEAARDRRDVESKIELFNSGKCPTCGTDLSFALAIKEELHTRKVSIDQILKELDQTVADNNDEINEAKSKLSIIDINWQDCITKITELKTEIKKSKDWSVPDVEPIVQSIASVQSEKDQIEIEFLKLDQLKTVHELLLPIWGEKGIKRDIIAEIVPTLNSFIGEDLIELNTRFSVKLDSDFDAHIYEWGNEIDPDTLSTGEAKKVNLVIMFAYLKMTRLSRFINILILDEAFASVDIDGIEDVLKLVKKWANEKGINIMIIHHSELNRKHFDRVIEIHKGAFSIIEDTKIE